MEFKGKQFMQSQGGMYEKVREMFGMDIRSLAFFRIGLAIASIGDLCERSLDLRAHYSDEGIFPRHVLFESYANNYTIFVHAISGHVYFQAFVFLLHAFCALCMLIGWRTKLFTFLTWIFLVSLQSRNPFLNHGGDLYFRLIFFYAMFLPLGGCFSVDSALSNVQHKSHRNPRVLTGGTVALIGQIAIMYIISTYHKTGSEWTTDFTSTWYALQLDYYKTDIARFLEQFHGMLKLLTWGVLHWEFLGNFCFFMPVFTDYFRLLAVLGFFSMHLGFILCIRLGFFFWVCTVAMFPLVPTLVWDWITNSKAIRTATQRAHTTLVRYDSHSKFSHAVAHIACTFFCIPKAQIAPYSQGFEPESQTYNSDAWLEVSTGSNTTQNFRALQTAFENSPMYPPTYPFRLALDFCARVLRTPVTYVARIVVPRVTYLANHYHATTRYNPPSPQVYKRKYIRISDIFVLFCMLYAISWNASNLGSSLHFPPSTNWIGLTLHLDQYWGMFSPHPPKAHWYYIIQAHKDTGEEFELFKNEGTFKWEGNTPFNFDKPNPFHKSFKNHRWYKFFEMGFNGDGHDNIRLNFGRWVCREYNSLHSGTERLHNYKVWFLLEWQTLYGGRSAPSKQVLWEHICYHKK